MMHGHEKSDSAIVAVKPTNKADAIRCGAGGAKGGDQGECEPAKHAPDAEPDRRVTGAGALTESAPPSDTRGRSRMRESCKYGSGAARLAAIPAGESPADRGVQSLL
jgi:hypothetical protein